MRARQRVLHDPGRRPRVHRRGAPLPGHVRGGLLRPARLRRSGPGGGERGPGQPAQLAAATVPRRRHAVVHPGPPGAAGVPAGPRPAPRRPDPHAALPGPARPPHPGHPAALRPRGRSAPGRAGDHHPRRGLVRATGGRVGAGRHGHQRRRGPLPGPQRGTPATGGHREQRGGCGLVAGAHRHLLHPHRGGGPHPAHRRRGPGALPGGGPAPPPRRPPVGHPGTAGPGGHDRKDSRPAHLPGLRDQQPGRGGGPAGPRRCRVPGVAGLPRPGLGPPVAPRRPADRRRGRRRAAAAHLPRPANPLPAHRRPGRRGARARPARGGVPGTRVLGRAVRPPVPEPALP